MASGLIKEPAYKVLLQQLASAQPVVPNPSSYRKWKINIKENTLTLTNIWVQGEVTEFNRSPASPKDVQMTVSDGTGVVKVLIDMKKLPSRVDDLAPGEHVMIAGYVLKAGILGECRRGSEDKVLTHTVTVKAIRVKKLKDTDRWVKEVEHAQQFILLHSKDVS